MPLHPPSGDDDDWSSERPWIDGAGSIYDLGPAPKKGLKRLPKKRPIGFLHFDRRDLGVVEADPDAYSS